MPYTHTFADIKNRPVAVFGAGTLGRPPVGVSGGE
jgi:hypothetical protein